MKLIKLKEVYDHYVIITDEEIKVDDIVLETRVDGSKGLEHIQTLNDIDPSSQKKVTHTSIPIIGLCLIDEDELKELLKMKLYTEEQVRRAMLHSYLSGVERPADYLPIEESILNELTPIELPKDEEIENSAKDYANIIGNKNGTAIFDYIKGAKWLRDKILNK